MLTNRVPTQARLVKPQIPSTRYEYQDSLPSAPLTGCELRVLLYLLKCGARTGEAWPKHQTIARVCRCHQDTARRATHRLEELGYIRIVRGRTFNRYRFPWHVGFSRSGSVATSDLPPYKGKPEVEPVIAPAWHNPALEIPDDTPPHGAPEGYATRPTPYFRRPFDEYRERFRRDCLRQAGRLSEAVEHPSKVSQTGVLSPDGPIEMAHQAGNGYHPRNQHQNSREICRPPRLDQAYPAP